MKDKGRKKNGSSSNYRDYKPFVSRNNEYHPQSVLDFTNGDRTKESDHPTQKPLSLIRYLIRTYSNIGDIVFDGYSGSGTTAAGCIVEKRIFKGSEAEEDIFYKSVKRLENYRISPELDLIHR